MRAIVLDECEGAPHEFRGVYRGGLLRTLQSGVPPDCIQYNSAVQSIVQDDDGKSSTWTLLQSQHSKSVMSAYGLQAIRESGFSGSARQAHHRPQPPEQHLSAVNM